MQLHHGKQKKGAPPAALQDTEQRLAAVFPESYKRAFMAANPPEAGEWQLFPIKDPQNLKKTWDDVIRQNTIVRNEQLPDHFIAISEDGTGDFLCLQAGENGLEEAVFHWNHETREAQQFAASMDEFLVSANETDLD